MAESSKALGIVVGHTHWDREWRYPMWKNRSLLVDFFDRLLDVFDRDPSYRNFLMDGQCVPVEDYLEIRPENEGRIRQAVSSGRLSIGPWYTLPDLYPLDGECLIRNLLKGIRLSERLGGSLPIGYNSFGWGQIAQFPQIYARFGFEFIVAAKNVSRTRAPACEFLWEAPDGTRVLTSRLGQVKRANAFFNLMIPVRFGVPVNSEAFRYDLARPWQVIHNADPDRCHEDHFRVDHEMDYHRDRVVPGVRAAWGDVDDTLAGTMRVLMNGSDFSDPLADLTRLIADANEDLDDIELIHGSLGDYQQRLREVLDLDALPVVQGEMRDGPANSCSANALATRIYLKIANKQAQNWLIRSAEPLRSALAMHGAAYPRAMLDVAWKQLLLAHPHDSINGVTQDKTAEDTENRIRQAIEIGQVVVEEAAAELALRIDYAPFDPESVCLLAVNPLPREVRCVCKLALDLPQSESVRRFDLVDADGRRFEVQPISIREDKSPLHDPHSRPWPVYSDRHRVWADLGELPACGYKVFRVEATETFRRDVDWWPAQRTSRGDELSAAPNEMENEHLRVVVAADGTLSLTDKATGRTYEGLGWFEDAGDVGDYWAYYPPHHDQVHTSRGGAARIWREDNGPLAATIVAEVALEVPRKALRARSRFQGEDRRVDETVPLVIRSSYTLKRGARRLHVRTFVNNTAEDHRLRVMFPTGLVSKHSDASGHFTVDRRPIDPPRDDNGEYWPEMQTLPQQHFVSVSDGRHGFAVVHTCFTEFEAMDPEACTLAVTLFRAMRNRICTEWRSTGAFPMQKGGQCLREMVFDYALVPHEGTWAEAKLYGEAERLNAPPVTYQTAARGRGDWPTSRSLLAVEPANLIVSTLKQAEDRDGFILRLFNPTSEPLKGRVRLPEAIARAWTTDLNERREDELPVRNGELVVTAAPQRIVTIELAT